MEKDDHNEIIRALGRLEGKFDGLDAKVTEGFARINGRIEKHDQSIAAINSENDQKKGQSTLAKNIGGGVMGFVSALGVVIIDHLYFRR